MITIDAKPDRFTLDPARCAVIVIDMQNDFGHAGGMFARAGIDISGIRAVVPAIARVLAAARNAGMPIVFVKMGFKPDLSDAGVPHSPNWVKHIPMQAGETVKAPDGRDSRILVQGTWNTDIIDELQPQPGDLIVTKHRYSAFYRTELEATLQRLGIQSLIFAGCTTSVCVESSVRDAMFRDYPCLVLSDCTAEPIAADAPRTNHEASLLTLQLLFAWVAESSAVIDALETTDVTALRA